MTAGTGAGRAAALARAAQADRLLVASDFDGTLAPLADEPMSVRMLPAARQALEGLARLPRVAVALVSGRSLFDLEVIAEHDASSPFLLAGSHGAEYWYPGQGAIALHEGGEDAALRDRLRAEALAATAGMRGVFIEPKTFGLGVHTRRADAPTAAAAHALVDEIVRRRAPQWRRRTGHDIVEYAFRHEGKDTALAHLREHTRATCVLFAGDDVSDEDALRSLGPQDVGIHVGGRPTAAPLTFADIPAFSGFLADLLRARRGASAR